MASHSLRSPHVELRESEIPKPQPLRIIKRSKTISGSTTSGETLCRGRGPSGSSKQSRGSPPLGIDRPLTVHKLRKGRGSVLNGSFDEMEKDNTVGAITELVREHAEKKAAEEDPDTTPKARKPVPRTMSAGQFLKTEFHRKSNDTTSYSVRGTRGSVASSDIDFMQQFPEGLNPDGSPKIPERRFSKSKNFLMRAIGGRTSPDKVKSATLAAHHRPWKHESVVDIPSRNTLIRRLSRSKNRVRTPWDPSSASDCSECSSSNCSFTPASFDIADMSINSRMSSSSQETPQMSLASDTLPLLPSESAILLTPQITVTPEISSIDAGHCSLWVAVEVSGVLRNADKDQVIGLRSTGPTSAQLSAGIWRYGYLHSMRIDILPARNCFITELVGDLHNGDPLRVGETRLILARFSLCRTIASPHIKESSSEELIADLENDLGGTLTPYLNVRLTYKHSGFLNYEIPLLASDGMNSHTTQLQTDASAVIRRHNSQSAWSPRTSQTLKLPITDNPLIKLIKLHLGPDRAEEAIKRLTDVENRPVPLSRRFGCAGGSSEETVKPFTNVISPTTSSTVSTSLVNALQKSTTMSHLPANKPDGPFARFPSPGKGDGTEEIDPARKIWDEMRRSSRSMRHRPRPRHGRNNISADHFYSMEEDPTSSPTRNSSSDATTATIDSSQSESAVGSRLLIGPDNGIEHERIRIMEMALKNKRSVGADTLRSIAPSVAKSVGKGKGGTIGGLGLGVGRSWGWGPPWW